MHQDVKYVFTADLSGISDRSIYEFNGSLFLYSHDYIDTDTEVLSPASVVAHRVDG